jgi:hypothetical protein
MAINLPKGKLNVTPELTIEHPSGIIEFISPSDDGLVLKFSSAKNFREFMRIFQDSFSLEKMHRFQQYIDSQSKKVNLFIGGKKVLTFTPEKKPEIIFRRLLPQYFLLLLGQ